MTKTQPGLLLRQQEIVKLIDFFILGDKNDDKQIQMASEFMGLL